jgi:hypothetical protein
MCYIRAFILTEFDGIHWFDVAQFIPSVDSHLPRLPVHGAIKLIDLAAIKNVGDCREEKMRPATLAATGNAFGAHRNLLDKRKKTEAIVSVAAAANYKH